MSTLVDLAVDPIVDTIRKREAAHGDLFELTASSLNELEETAGAMEVLDTLMGQLSATPRPITADQALAAIRQAVTYCIEASVPWFRCKTILEAVWGVVELRW